MEQRVLLSGYVMNTLASFTQYPNGQYIQANVVLDSSGNLFGTTLTGGAFDGGTIFEIAKGTTTPHTLASISGPNAPHGSEAALAIDSAGDLFGTTSGDSPGPARTSAFGTIFELPHGATSTITLASFNGINGANPYGVIRDSSGDLFGTAQTGGDANGDGTVFELAHGTSTITALATFNGTNGTYPNGVTLDSSGNLFGTTNQGGTSGYGVAFEIPASNHTLSDIASFNVANGPEPTASVTLDSSGDLFGTTGGGWGTIFEIPKGSSTISDFATFNKTDGAQPYATVTFDASGDLFGTTLYGGANGYGVVYEIPAGTNTITTLANFSTSTGVDPFAGVVLDSNGDLFGVAGQSNPSIPTSPGGVYEIVAGSGTVTPYPGVDNTSGTAFAERNVALDSSGDVFGTTRSGGANNGGTVFEIAKGSTTATTLINLDAPNEDDVITTVDSSGNLFGTTIVGGADNDGSVFEIARGSGSITTLVSFNGADGAGPSAGLTLDSSGNLFGATGGGGANSHGTVFEIAKGSGVITDLVSFNGTNGNASGATLALDSSGDLFGTTISGGANNAGTVFEIVHGSGVLTTLGNFGGTTGIFPAGGASLDSSGDLFGTTQEGGGFPAGTVWEVAHGTSAITVVTGFNFSNGSAEFDSAVTLDSYGNIYGTTEHGGANNDGSVYEIPQGTSTITTLFSFNGLNGSFIQSVLSIDSSGDLIGTTTNGGAAGTGSVFELVPVRTSVSLAPASPVVYGTAVKFTATVTAASGGAPPPAGSVTFIDVTKGNTVLGTASVPATTGSISDTWSCTTTAKQLNVTAGDTIEAIYRPGIGYTGSSGTTKQVVTARPITVTAATNSKIYSGTTSAAAVPTITSGSLVTGDTANFTETYSTANPGTNLTLTPAGSVNDGNGGGNYAVSFVTNSTGTITAPAPTLASISPNSAVARAAATTITLTGTGFFATSSAKFNGTAIATTFVNATTLTAVIPAADLLAAGPDSVTVFTPSPGGGTSAGQAFIVSKAIPTGSLNAPGPFSAGQAVLQFTITYVDNIALNAGTFGNNDVQVSGPNGFSQTATFVSVNITGNGTPRTVTYSITAPGGALSPSADGTYTVTALANGVSNTSGNGILAATLGTFVVTTSNVWKAAVSGDWDTAANWTLAHVPTATEDAVINLPGAYTVTHSVGTDAVYGIYSTAAFTLSGGQITLGTIAQISNTFILGAGKLIGGTVNAGTGGQGITAAAGGTLSGVTLAANVVIGNGDSLNITNGLTLSGGHTITLASTGSPSSLIFIDAGAQTLGGTGAIVFGGTLPAKDTLSYVNSVGHTLSIASGITIHGGGGNIIAGSTVATATAIVNGGTITADTAGQTISISGQSFTNAGTMSATAGNLSVIVGKWSDSGHVNLTGGNFTTNAASNTGTLSVSAGHSFTSTAAVFTNSGVLTGTGTFAANVTNSGTITPGLPLGTLTIAGNFTQTSTGTLKTQIGGATTGKFSTLAVTGTATLAGLDDIYLVSGFHPAIGNTFAVVTYGKLVGAFTKTDGTSLGGGIALALANGAASATLTAATAPADTTPPTVSTVLLGTATKGATTFRFTVTYADNIAIDLTTLGSSNVIVTGPNGFSQTATYVAVSKSNNGTPRTVTYQLAAPGGALNYTANGIYTVKVLANSVKDTRGNPVAAGAGGTFTLALPIPSIFGHVFHDLNGNGLQDTGETGFSGVTLYIDSKNTGAFVTGAFVTGDPTAVTDAAGNFSFATLAAGTYVVREVLPSGYHLTTPTAGFLSITVTAGKTSTGALFGDK